MKIKYFIFLLIGTIFLIIIGGGLYFVSQISAVYPPIKVYEFHECASDLKIEIIKTLDNKDKFEYKFTDIVGNKRNGYAYYVDLRIKGQQIDNNYTFKYYDKKRFLRNAIISKIDLIEAIDKIHGTGGYKIDDLDVIRLIGDFEKEFIDKILIDKQKK